MDGSENFDQAIEKLLSDQSPRLEAQSLDDEERDMLRMAQLLRGSRTEAPAPQFVERLHDNLFPRARRVSRRIAFVSGFGALAAGILAGLGIDRAVQDNGTTSSDETAWKVPLVNPKRGTWVHVADVVEVPHGAVRSFTAGAVQGVLINDGGKLRAISSICTHMGCALKFQQAEQHLACPCHGAAFNLAGRVVYGVAGYTELPALPPIQVKVQGEKILVLGA